MTEIKTHCQTNIVNIGLTVKKTDLQMARFLQPSTSLNLASEELPAFWRRSHAPVRQLLSLLVSGAEAPGWISRWCRGQTRGIVHERAPRCIWPWVALGGGLTSLIIMTSTVLVSGMQIWTHCRLKASHIVETTWLWPNSGGGVWLDYVESRHKLLKPLGCRQICLTKILKMFKKHKKPINRPPYIAEGKMWLDPAESRHNLCKVKVGVVTLRSLVL